MLHLITGGSGFLGSLIAERLLALGENVRVLDVWENPDLPPEVESLKGDVLDRGCVAASMRAVDCVHHNAALVPLTKAGRRQFWKVNVLGSQIVAEEAARAKVRSFIHMSSSAIFGQNQCPIREGDAPAPVESYGHSKHAGELAVNAALKDSAVRLLIVRPRTILGPRRLGIFQILFDWIRQGKNVYLIGPGTERFQFVHADDLLAAYLLALEKGRTGVFNLGTDRYGSLREALENLIEYSGTGSRVKSLPVGPAITALRVLDATGLSPLAPWHYLSYHKPFYFDVAPIQELGWKPKYSNDEMMRECFDWFKENRGQISHHGSPHRTAVRENILKVVKFFS